MPAIRFHPVCLMGALMMLSLVAWGIANVFRMPGTGSANPWPRGLGPPVRLTSASAAAEDDTCEIPSEKPAVTKPISQPRAFERTDLSFPLSDEPSVQRLLRNFPELSEVISFDLVDIRLTTVPDDVLEKVALHRQKLQRFGIRRPAFDHALLAENPPAISNRGMEHITRMRHLQSLRLACEFSPEGFRHLARLENLRSLGLSYLRLSAKECFENVAQFPKIDSLYVGYADFSKPIDDATHQAIASLNGRLEQLDFGEWEAETTLHASLIPAIAEIESLRWLHLGPVVGSVENGTDYRDHLRKLHYLDTRLLTLRTRERFPVHYRPVESPGEMIVLLGHLIGDVEARKIPREIIRRRMGLSLAVDFTESRVPLWQILKESFDLDTIPGSSQRLYSLCSAYPEIDRQIRHYLSGLDIPVEP